MLGVRDLDVVAAEGLGDGHFEVGFDAEVLLGILDPADEFHVPAESPNSARRTWGGRVVEDLGVLEGDALEGVDDHGEVVCDGTAERGFGAGRGTGRGDGRGGLGANAGGGEFAGFRWTATEVTDRDPTRDWENSVQIGDYAEHGVRLYKVVVTTRNADGGGGLRGGGRCGWGTRCRRRRGSWRRC